MQDVGEHDLYDIRFNFIIGEFGIFEGRGWNAVPDIDDNQLYIGFVSIDNEEKCTEFSEQLIKNGIRLGKLNKEFKDEELVTDITTMSFPTTSEMTSTEGESKRLPFYYADFS